MVESVGIGKWRGLWSLVSFAPTVTLEETPTGKTEGVNLPGDVSGSESESVNDGGGAAGGAAASK